MLLFLNSLAHFLVDGLCLATLFGTVYAEADIVSAVILYNTLAFSTQCLVGLVTDSTGRWEWLCCGSEILVVLGFILPLPWYMKIVFIGLGNSLFHVTGGSMTLRDCGGKAAKLGVFVAPGAIGVTLGSLWPKLGIFFALALLVCAVEMGIMALNKKPENPMSIKSGDGGHFPVLAVILLTAAVAVRAVGGSAVSFPWKSGALQGIVMTLCVFGGKTAGGFVCDRIGAEKSAYISIPLSALLIAFCSEYMLPSLLGQLLLNLSMPVTLYLLYKAIPDSPGLAFGLAASALWPGTIAGQMFTLTGPALWLCVIASFLFGLGAIVYSEKNLRRINV